MMRASSGNKGDAEESPSSSTVAVAAASAGGGHKQTRKSSTTDPGVNCWVHGQAGGYSGQTHGKGRSRFGHF